MRLPWPLISTRICQLSQGLQIQAVFAQQCNCHAPSLTTASASFSTAHYAVLKSSQVCRATASGSRGLSVAAEHMRKCLTSTSALACQLLACRKAGRPEGLQCLPLKRIQSRGLHSRNTVFFRRTAQLSTNKKPGRLNKPEQQCACLQHACTLAAGCSTSSNFRIVAPSFVMVTSPMSSTSICTEEH